MFDDPMAVVQLYGAAVIIFWMCIGATTWEMLLHLKFDYNLLTRSKQRRRPWVLIPYFGSKVGWWLYISFGATSAYSKHKVDCKNVMRAMEAAMGIVVLCSTTLLAVRATCVFQGEMRRKVTRVLTAALVLLATIWVIGVTDLTSVWVVGAGNPWTDGVCSTIHVSKRYAIKYCATIACDCLVLGLTVLGVARMARHSGSTGRIGTLLVDQGIWYFTVTFMVNILVTICTLLPGPPVFDLLFAVLSACISVIASTRLYGQLSISLNNAPAGSGGVNSKQLSSTGSTGSSLSSKVLSAFSRRRRRSQMIDLGSTCNAGEQASGSDPPSQASSTLLCSASHSASSFLDKKALDEDDSTAEKIEIVTLNRQDSKTLPTPCHEAARKLMKNFSGGPHCQRPAPAAELTKAGHPIRVSQTVEHSEDLASGARPGSGVVAEDDYHYEIATSDTGDAGERQSYQRTWSSSSTAGRPYE